MTRRLLAAAALLSGCTGFAESRIDGDVPRTPALQAREHVQAAPAPAPSQEILARLQQGGRVSLAQLIEFALRTSPATRATWSDARAAAALVGARQSTWYPEIDLTGGYEYSHRFLSQSATFTTKDFNAGAQLSWLLLDAGGRSSDISEARALLAASNAAHDQSVQDLILQVQQAYTQYQAARALRVSLQASVGEARVAYEAAEALRSHGLATVADVLQAKTALSQAQLNLTQAEGQVAVLRGSVATAIGVPATVPIEPEDLPEIDVEKKIGRVEELIAQAEKERPELAQARATALAAQSHADAVRWRGWPQLVLTGNASHLWFVTPGYPQGDNYGAALSLRFPLFTGFRDSYDAAQAREQANAAAARAESVEQQAVLAVWTSYQNVETAAQRVRTSRDLLASAEQSAQVAQGRYKEGVGSILDLLIAQSALSSARAQEVQARADWLLALASLAHDTGTLGPAEGEQR
jgi:outer membrane protein